MSVSCQGVGLKLRRDAAIDRFDKRDTKPSGPSTDLFDLQEHLCGAIETLNRKRPPVPDALSGATMGNRVLALSVWLHYALGNTLSQIVDVFNVHLQLPMSEGDLLQMWYQLQAILFAWYEEIQQQAS